MSGKSAIERISYKLCVVTFYNTHTIVTQ